MEDYGIFSHEGLVESGFYGVLPAEDRRQELIFDDEEDPEDIWVARVCPDHEEEQADHCSICYRDK